MNRLRSVLWIALGATALLLGVVGLFLPIVPTVPFVILAALCFSHGCERCERWLLEHPRLGPPLRAWREEHAVSRRAKQIATASMAVGCAVTWWLLGEGWLRWVPIGACTAVAGWMWSLPEPRGPRSSG